jgi:hypothetical protein
LLGLLLSSNVSMGLIEILSKYNRNKRNKSY